MREIYIILDGANGNVIGAYTTSALAESIVANAKKFSPDIDAGIYQTTLDNGKRAKPKNNDAPKAPRVRKTKSTSEGAAA